MASVGMLAAGAVHQINSPLTQVSACLELIAEEVSRLGPAAQSDSATRIAELLKKARDNAERIKAFIHDISTFSRVGGDKAVAIDIRRILDSSVNFAQFEIQNRARLTKNYAEVPPIRGNGGQLNQAFMNLLLNAAQAIPEGEKSTNEIRVSTEVDVSGRVIVTISDTGFGIPTDLLGRIFDPFFTTKRDGESTGLGLSIAKSIILSCGGEIKVTSQVGKGSTFTVIFPGLPRKVAIQAPVSIRPNHVATSSAAPSKRARILVIDDEAGIGDLLNTIFATDHDVVNASSGSEGLKLLAEGGNFDVILCDLMMPEITGMEVFERLKKLRPEMTNKFIFMTGGTFTSHSQEFVKSSFNRTIEKPFKIGALRQLVCEMVTPEAPRKA